MSFGAPFCLWALPLFLAGLVLLWLLSARQAASMLKNAFNTPLLARLLISVDPRRRGFKRIAVALALTGLLVALARPQWGRNEVAVERTGVDLVIALDVSRSMLAPDAGQTNRLHAARTAIQQLLHSMGGDRVGLVAFAGEAFMLAPLTRDHVAVDRALRSATPDMLSEQGSNLAEAIAKAAETYEQGAEGPRALLVVSDGEQLQGDALEAARKAYQHGIRVHTAGVGSATGSTIPAEGSRRFVRNALGREVVSRRDELKLQRISTAGGGVYTRIETRDSKALVEWFRRTAATLPRSVEKQVLNEPREQFQWPLALALGLLAIEWVAGDRKRAPGKRNTGAANRRTLPAGAGSIPRPATAVSQASNGVLFLIALAGSGQVACAAPAPWELYNQGVEAYARADYTNALQRWQELSLQTVPRGLQRPVWFQLGNVHFRLGEPFEQKAPEQAIELWTRSCEAYRSALAVKPRDADVLHNLAFVEARLARLLHRLGLDAFRSAANQPPNPAIDLLRDSVDYLDRALELTPADAPLQTDTEQAHRVLRERLQTRAGKSEAKGDELAPQSSERAENEYRSALQDLEEARKLQSATAAIAPDSDLLDQAISRVEQKLSQLLTRRGQAEQKQGDVRAAADPGGALDHYESALEHFRAAQEVQPSNHEARSGEREVLSAMESLHVRQGNAELKRGKEALALQSPRSAQILSEAVSQFDAALQLNAKNHEARTGADEARRLLPQALTLAGQSELKAGDRSEPRSVSDALAHYQEAEKDFRQALELSPKHDPAVNGLKEAEEKLARARSRAGQEAENAAAAALPQNQPPRTLESLLGQVTEKVRTPELQRERQRGVRNYSRPRYHEDW